MMRKLLILTLAVMAVAGCNKPANPSSGSGTVTPPNNGGGSGSGTVTPPNNGGGSGQQQNTPYFTINIKDVITLVSEVISQTSYSTNLEAKDISATASADWCSVTIANNAITIRVPKWGKDPEKNGLDAYRAPRNCTVTIKAGTVYNKTITIYQESDDALVNPDISGGSVKVNPGGETVILPITTNCVSWTATTTADWVALKVLDNGNLQIVTSPRPDSVTSKRTAKVTLKSAANYHIESSFSVEETDPTVGPGNYSYGEKSNWD